MRRVLLSASLPIKSEERDPDPFSGQDIGLAAAAVIEAVLRAGDLLVMGGHPSISPLALNIAALLSRGPLVSIYQSSYFESSVTTEVRRLLVEYGAELHWIRARPELAGSLEDMRTAMLAEPLDLAFFVGGMSGIEDEFRALGASQPGCVRHIFARPGGRSGVIAAKLLADLHLPKEPDPVEGVDHNTVVLTGRGYAALTTRALSGPSEH